MDGGELLRLARRRAGLSQRALAVAAGVARSTVEEVEAGRREPSVVVLQKLLAVAGLELSAEPVVADPCPHLLRHLRLSLSARLHLLTGGDGRPRHSPPVPAWTELGNLAARGRLFLTGASAVGLWVPSPPPLPRPVIGLQLHAPAPPPAAEHVDLRLADLPQDCTVAVPLPVRSVMIPSPLALALQAECAPWRRALRTAARTLEKEHAVDLARRRQPAHREPRPEAEAWRLLFARRWQPRLLPPDPLDGRGWRLDDEVGMHLWIERRADRGG